MIDKVQEIVVMCFRMVMSDAPWEDLGFGKRPKYGAFFQKFRSKWKVELEKRALQEMLSAFTAAYVIAGVVASDDISEIVATYISSSDVVKSLGYTSKEEGASHLNSSIREYLSAPTEDWGVLLANKMNLKSIPDKKVYARLFVGCSQFGMNVQRIIAIIKHGT